MISDTFKAPPNSKAYTMFSAFLIYIVLAALLFLKVFGARILDAIIEDRAENAPTIPVTRLPAPARLPVVDMEKLNAQLFKAFGSAESRELIDCTPYDHIEVEVLDSEFALILEDDTLSTSQALAQISELLNREGRNA